MRWDIIGTWFSAFINKIKISRYSFTSQMFFSWLLHVTYCLRCQICNGQKEMVPIIGGLIKCSLEILNQYTYVDNSHCDRFYEGNYHILSQDNYNT